MNPTTKIVPVPSSTASPRRPMAPGAPRKGWTLVGYTNGYKPRPVRRMPVKIAPPKQRTWEERAMHYYMHKSCASAFEQKYRTLMLFFEGKFVDQLKSMYQRLLAYHVARQARYSKRFVKSVAAKIKPLTRHQRLMRRVKVRVAPDFNCLPVDQEDKVHSAYVHSFPPRQHRTRVAVKRISRAYPQRPISVQRNSLLLAVLRKHIKDMRDARGTRIEYACLPRIHFCEPQSEVGAGVAGEAGQIPDQAHDVIITTQRTEDTAIATTSKHKWTHMTSSDFVEDNARMTDRWLKYQTFVWNTSHQINKQLIGATLPKDFIESDVGNQRCNVPNFVPFNIYAYWRGTIEIKVHVNSNKFQLGQLQMSWLYDEAQMKGFNRSIFRCSQLPNVVVNAGSSNEASLTIPYRHFLPLINTKTRGDLLSYLSLGRLMIQVLVPLATGLDGPQSCSGTVFIKLSDSEFTGLRNGAIQQMDGLLNVAESLLNMRHTPANMDEPPNHTSAPYVVPLASHSLSIGNNLIEPINPLRLDGRGVTPAPIGCEPDIQMTVTDVIRRQALIKQVPWTKQDLMGAQLWTMEADPVPSLTHAFPMYATGDFVSFQVPPITYISSMFHYFRGTIKLDFDIVTAMSLTGSLMVGYVPGVVRSSVMSLDLLRASPNVVIDLQEQQKFTFVVPFVADRPWWRRKLSAKLSTLDYACHGMVYMYVLNPLVNVPTSPDGVVINIYMSAGDDFELSVPLQPALGLAKFDKFLIPANDQVYANVATYYPGTWHLWGDGNQLIFRSGTLSDQVAYFHNLPNDTLSKYYYVPSDIAKCPKYAKSGQMYLAQYAIAWKDGEYVYMAPIAKISDGPKIYAAITSKSNARIALYAITVTDTTTNTYSGPNLYWKPVLFEPEAPFAGAVFVDYQGPDSLLLNPTSTMPTFEFGNLSFGEKFDDLKTLCRRYQIYGQVIIPKLSNIDNNRCDLRIPVLPMGLDLDYGTPGNVNELWNRCREGHIPYIANLYRHFRGGINFKILMPSEPCVVYVQHRPDRITQDRSIQFCQDLRTSVALINHTYATVMQVTSVNRVVEVSVPFYQPGCYGLLQTPNYNNIKSEIEFTSLGELVLNISIDPDKYNNIAGKIITIFYSISDDMQFSTFIGNDLVIDIGTIPDAIPQMAEFEPIMLDAFFSTDSKYFPNLSKQFMYAPRWQFREPNLDRLTALREILACGADPDRISNQFASGKIPLDPYLAMIKEATIEYPIDYSMLELVLLTRRSFPDIIFSSVSSFDRIVADRVDLLMYITWFIKCIGYDINIVEHPATRENMRIMNDEWELLGLNVFALLREEGWTMSMMQWTTVPLVNWEQFRVSSLTRRVPVIVYPDASDTPDPLPLSPEVQGIFDSFKTKVKEEINDNVREAVSESAEEIVNTITEEVAKVKFSAGDWRTYLPFLSQVVHCIVTPNIKTFCVAVVSCLVQAGLIVWENCAKIIEALTKALTSLIKRESRAAPSQQPTGAEEVNAEPQSDSIDPVCEFLSVLFVSFSSVVALSTKPPSNMSKWRQIFLFDIPAITKTSQCLLQVFKNIANVTNRMYNYIFCSVDPMIGLNDTLYKKPELIHRWVQEVNYLTQSHVMADMLTDSEYINRVYFAEQLGGIIITALSPEARASAQVSIITGTHIKIRRLSEDLVALGTYPNIRKEPFILYNYGLPGVGKSFGGKRLCKDLLISEGITTRRGMMCEVNAADKYWSQCNGQPVLVVDDMWNIMSGTLLEQQVALLFTVCSSAVLNPPMAAVEDKKRRYNPEIFLMNSNHAFPVINNVDAIAVYRRRHLFFEFSAAPLAPQDHPLCEHCKGLPLSFCDEEMLADMHHVLVRTTEDVTTARDDPFADCPYMKYENFLYYAKKKFNQFRKAEMRRFEARIAEENALRPGVATVYSRILEDPAFTVDDTLQNMMREFERDLAMRTAEMEKTTYAKFKDFFADLELYNKVVNMSDKLFSGVKKQFTRFAKPTTQPQSGMHTRITADINGDYQRFLHILPQGEYEVIDLDFEYLCDRIQQLSTFAYTYIIQSGKIPSTHLAMTNTLLKWPLFEEKLFAPVVGTGVFDNVTASLVYQRLSKIDTSRILHEKDIWKYLWRDAPAAEMVCEHCIDLTYIDIDPEPILAKIRQCKRNPTDENREALQDAMRVKSYLLMDHKTSRQLASYRRLSRSHDNTCTSIRSHECASTCVLKHEFTRWLYVMHLITIPVVEQSFDSPDSCNSLFYKLGLRDEFRFNSTVIYYGVNNLSETNDSVSLNVIDIWKANNSWIDSKLGTLARRIWRFIREHWKEITSGLLALSSLILLFTSSALFCQEVFSNGAGSTFQGEYNKGESSRKWSKGPTKPSGSRPSMPPREPQSSTQQVEAVISKLNENICELILSNGQHLCRFKCLGLRNRVLLVIRHYIEAITQRMSNDSSYKLYLKYGRDLEQYSTQKLGRLLNFENLEFDWLGNATGKSVHNSNIGVVTLPNNVPEFKNIVKFIASERMRRNIQLQGTLYEDRYSISDIRFEWATIPYTSGDDYSSYVQLTESYTYPKQAKGMCGSILICNNLQTPIIGIHVAGIPDKLGRPGKGIAEPLWSELFVDMPCYEPYDYDVEDVPFLVDEKPSLEVYNSIFQMGRVKPSLVHHQPTSSNLTESLIHGVIPVLTEPNPLSKYDSRLPTQEDPIVSGCSKHGLYPYPPSSKVIDICKDSLERKLLYFVKPIRKPQSVCTLQEVICGIATIGEFGALTWDTSEGFPLSSKRPKSATSKKWLFNLDEGTEGYIFKSFHPMLQVVYDHELESRKRGIKVPTVFVDCLKDTAISAAKCRITGKTRIFSISPVQYTIIFRQYYGEFIACFKRARLDAEHAIGIAPDGPEWSEVVIKLTNNSSNIVTGDYSNFGPALCLDVARRAFEIVLRWYEKYTECTQEDQQVRWILAQEILCSWHLAYDNVYRVPCGIPSGSPITDVLNSMVNMIYVRESWLSITNLSISMFEEHCTLITYGDDLIMSVSDDIIDRFNTITMGQYFWENRNIKFTDVDKTGELIKCRTIDRSSFLKRGFVNHPKRMHMFLAPVDEMSIGSCVNWIRKSKNKEDATVENVKQACELAYGHGKKYYHKLSKTLTEALIEFDIYVNIPSWDDVDRRVFDLNERLSLY